MKNQVKTPKKSKPKKENKVARSLVDVLNGDFLTKDGAVNNLPYLLFLAFVALLYIANGYTAESTVRDINRIESELKEARSEYISTKSELDNDRTQSRLAKTIEGKGLGLEESRVPPKKIVVTEEDLED